MFDQKEEDHVEVEDMKKEIDEQCVLDAIMEYFEE